MPSDDFRIDICRADKNRTFVRVVHIPSGKQRFQVGLGHENANEVAVRFIREWEWEGDVKQDNE